MIEMDVGQEDLADVLRSAIAFALERRFAGLMRRRRPGIDERDAGRAVKDCCGDDFRATEKVQVDVVDSPAASIGIAEAILYPRVAGRSRDPDGPCW